MVRNQNVMVFVTFGMSFASSKKKKNTGIRFVFIRKKRVFSVCRVLEPPYVDQISGNYKIYESLEGMPHRQRES